MAAAVECCVIPCVGKFIKINVGGLGPLTGVDMVMTSFIRIGTGWEKAPIWGALSLNGVSAKSIVETGRGGDK